LSSLLRRPAASLPGLVQAIHSDPDLAYLSMQMFYVLQALGRHEFALEMQARALTLQRVFRIRSPGATTLRLLAFMGPGAMLDNTPLEFITEHIGVRLDLLYLLPGCDLPEIVPDHDVAIVALGESDKNKPLLLAAQSALRDWPRPVLNRPGSVLNCARDAVFDRLRGEPGLRLPLTRSVRRADVVRLVPPFTIRPPDTHAGEGLRRIDAAAQCAPYLAQFQSARYQVSEYVDCRGADGRYRKMRVAIVDGRPYAIHLAVSDDWIVHYMSAGMESSSQRRAEEAAWMTGFRGDFDVRHGAACSALAEKLDLEYVVIDCAEASDGRLLLFEADTRALIHATDPVDLFGYKVPVLQLAFNAFRTMLERRIQRD